MGNIMDRFRKNKTPESPAAMRDASDQHDQVRGCWIDCAHLMMQ